MAVNCSPFGPKPQFELSSGAPAFGYQLFFYAAGSVSTKQNTYTDSTGATPNPNPVVLNASGQPTNQLWLTAGQSYKVVYAPAGDTDPPSSPIWTIDNLVGINDVTVTIADWIAGPTPTYTGVSTFTLLGDQTSTFHIGRRIKTINSGGTKYGTITNSVFTTLTTVTVSNDSGSLDSGLSAVFYGLIDSQNTSLPKSDHVLQTMGVSPAMQLQTYTAFTAGGIATAYTLTPNPAITANTANTAFYISFPVAAGLSPTLAVSGLAALPIKYRDSAGALQPVTSIQIPINWVSKVYTDGTNWIALDVASSNVIRGYIDGMVLSTAGASTTMSIAAGQAADSTNAAMISIAAMSKTTAAWAAGSGSGGLDTGAIANATWYYFYAIRNATSGATDVIFSLSSASPALPTGYTQYRYIGAGLTNGAAQWVRFVQSGDDFYWETPVVDYSGASTTPGSLVVVSVPRGRKVKAVFNLNNTTGAACSFYLSDPSLADVAPAQGTIGFSTNGSVQVQATVWTDTSAQIRHRTLGPSGGTLVIQTIGWTDLRGKSA